VRALRKVFSSGGLLSRGRPVVALDDVSFTVGRGEAVAVVGESGSGKSTIARVLLRLTRPDAGEIVLDGQDVLAAEPRRASLAYRARVQMVFQDPFGSLNPVHPVEHHLARPLLRHGRARREELPGRVLELLRTVGLEPAEEIVRRHPHQLSGGQRQRVAIARALAVEPDVLVADEPTSMLDVSIRSGILALLARLKRERALSVVLITHDLAAARLLADRILVLYRGRLVEDGPTAAVVDAPAHPYTRALLAAASHAAPIEPPVAHAPPAGAVGEGCPFAPRCPEVLAICRTIDPRARPLGDGRRVSCHLHAEGSPAERR
jgi:peptide/nickel transport system ATP-binding protein